MFWRRKNYCLKWFRFEGGFEDISYFDLRFADMILYMNGDDRYICLRSDNDGLMQMAVNILSKKMFLEDSEKPVIVDRGYHLLKIGDVDYYPSIEPNLIALFVRVWGYGLYKKYAKYVSPRIYGGRVIQPNSIIVERYSKRMDSLKTCGLAYKYTILLPYGNISGKKLSKIFEFKPLIKDQISPYDVELFLHSLRDVGSRK